MAVLCLALLQDGGLSRVCLAISNKTTDISYQQSTDFSWARQITLTQLEQI